jgi:hypothetical protein
MPNEHDTIVKVQTPLLSSIGVSAIIEVLVYNEDRSIEFVIETDANERKIIKKAMKGEDKAFFYACRHCEQVDFNRPAPYQGW